MEEEKAAAYYEELTRKGEGAARFKQGLGFTPQSSTMPTKGSAFPSSSSFLSSFVKASGKSIPEKSIETQKQQSQLENIQNKLKKKQNSESLSTVPDNRSRRRSISRDRDGSSRRRSGSRSRDGHDSRRRNRSLSRDRDRGRKIERKRSSRSRSSSDEERRRRRSPHETHSRQRRSGGSSPRRNRETDKGRGYGRRDNKSEGNKEKEKNSGIEFSRLIKGYEEMTSAERVKAKMKLQLSKTVEKDIAKGMGAGWERFEFNKDAPLDDEEMEVVEDDKVLVKNIGQSFRFSAVEAKREEHIKAAHDTAMFGVPVAQPSSPLNEESILEDDKKENKESNLCSSLISDKVLEKQQGSWRDRARKLQDGSKS